jgi:hypothetical protein
MSTTVGVRRNSARCKKLPWFTKGQLMVPTSANYLQLLTEFPEAELRNTPPKKENARTPVTGQVELGLMRGFERIAHNRPLRFWPTSSTVGIRVGHTTL